MTDSAPPVRSAEVVAVGTELTSGAKLDRHGQWLSDALAGVGIVTRFHQTVDDDLRRMVDALAVAKSRSDLVLITGGLGPTLDDLTRDALAELAGVELAVDEKSLRHLRALYKLRERTMPERNVVQATFPVGSEILPNPIGTAPGIWMTLPTEDGTPCHFAAMPGVPSEMHRMFTEQVLPRLPRSPLIIRRARVNCFGAGESDMEERLGELTARGRVPEIGITASAATITLRIEARAEQEHEVVTQLETARVEIRERLADLVFGEEDDRLEDVIAAALVKRGQSVAVVEVATGGALADCLTDRPDASDWFRGGLAVASLSEAARWLDTESDLRTVAETLRERSAGTYVLAVSDVDSDSMAVTVLLVSAAGISERHLRLLGNPDIQKSRTVKTALDLLRLHLAALA